MSRLDVLIKRMSAQRECLNYTIELLKRDGQEGIVVELGLGSGRTYDHLRENLPEREIFVFDYKVECHPNCTPPANMTILGEIQKSLPSFAEAHSARAAFIHCDIGTKDRDRDRKLYLEITPSLQRLARPGAYIASDRELSFPGLEELGVPTAPGEWPYFLYRVNGRET